MTIVNIRGKEFYLDDILRSKLDNLKDIVYKKNWDGVFIVDGLERVGKSTLGISCAYYLADGNFTVDNICASGDEAIQKIESFPDKSVLLIDEGSLIFNSKDAMKTEQKKIMKILNVVGQKNMIFIIILPSFFDLNKSIAIRRSKFLLHCYTDKQLLRGRFAYFGEDAKKILYSVGKKNYDSYEYPKRNQNELGRYTDFNPLGQEYIETKKKSLYSALHDEKVGDRWTAMLTREIKIKLFKQMRLNLPIIYQKDLAKAFGVSDRAAREWLNTKIDIKKGGVSREEVAEPIQNNP